MLAVDWSEGCPEERHITVEAVNRKKEDSGPSNWALLGKARFWQAGENPNGCRRNGKVK